MKKKILTIAAFALSMPSAQAFATDVCILTEKYRGGFFVKIDCNSHEITTEDRISVVLAQKLKEGYALRFQTMHNEFKVYTLVKD